jgi:hypothetical protein
MNATLDRIELARAGGVAKAAMQIAAGQAAVAGVLEVWGGFPPLDTVEHAMERLDMICRLAIEYQAIDGARAGAGVRAVEQWLKAYDLQRLQLRIAELEAQVAAYKADRTVGRRGR